MKKTLLYSLLLLSVSAPAMAQNAILAPAQAAMPAIPAEDPVMTDVKYLQDEWARIKYQIAEDDDKLTAIHTLETKAAQISATYPARAEPKIWEAIVLSTDAGIVKGMSALSKVEKAKELLEASQQIDPKALEGSAYTSLGSLYYQVPGWPVAFGDDDKAETNLKQALQINPAGIDPNFFYGDFLLQDDRPQEAKIYLERALQAQNRPGRELADAGRRQEIKAALATIQAKQTATDKAKYN